MTALRMKLVPVLVLFSTLLGVHPAPYVHAFGKPKPPSPEVSPPPIGKIRVMWRGDASTTAVVGFGTQDPPSPSLKLYYDTVDHGVDISQYPQSRGIDAQNNSKGMNNAFVRLTGLSPSTPYYFVIADGPSLSARYWFKTAPATPDQRLSIVAGGDSRNNSQPRRAANLLVSKLRPDAVMFGGDMTQSGSDSQWNEWFDDWQLSIASDGRVTPLVMTRGNHEGDNSVLVNLFDTPINVYYTTSIGGTLLRAYTLNSEMSIGGTQTDWLSADLAANTSAIWKIAQYHHPMRPHTGSKGEGSNQYRYWAPLFDRYRMDVVVECDSHTVKQTWPVRASSGSGSSDGFTRDDVNGVVYVGEGGWGAPLRSNDRDYAWTRDSGKFNHFQWMFISARELEIRTVKVDNASAVSALTEDTRFSLPTGIDVWSPSNGSVVRLAK